MRVFSKEQDVSILVTDCERRIIITALKKLKEEQIRENKNYDFLDTIIVKTSIAQPVRKRMKSYEER